MFNLRKGALRSFFSGGRDKDEVVSHSDITTNTADTAEDHHLQFWDEVCAIEAQADKRPFSHDHLPQLPECRPVTPKVPTKEIQDRSFTTTPTTIVSTTDDQEIVPSRSTIDERRDAAIVAIFDRLDLDHDGLLNRQDLEAMLLDATDTIKLKLDASIIDAAIDALIEDAESEEALRSLEISEITGGYNAGIENSSLASCDALESINKAQFSDIFKRHPAMLRAFLEHHHGVAKKRTSPRPMSESERLVEQEENEQIWQTRWKNWNVSVFWLVLYLLANAAAFTIKVVKYYHNDEAQAVFGSCIMIARGAAQCLNINCALILLPMGRHFITRLRATRARFYFPFDAILGFHKLVGFAILFWTVIHVGAHMSDFYMFSHADEEDIYALVGDKLGPVPEGEWERWQLLLKSKAGITGVVMVVCMLIGYPTIRYRRQYFNTFWTTHHLLIVMLIALCIHGTGNLVEQYQTIWWMLFPFAVYLIPRFLRESYCSQTTVIDAKVKKGGVVCLRLQKPAHWDPILKPGMYAFLHVPAVSRFEWHPFTLTSSIHDPYLEFHILSAGDWTSALHEHVQSLDNRRHLELSCDAGLTINAPEDSMVPTRGIHRNDSMFLPGGSSAVLPPPEAVRSMVVKVEGPIGASSQGFKDYPILVLVGAGIGVTPMISVLKELLDFPGRVKRVFFYWTVRDRAAFELFSDLMNKIYRKHDTGKGHVLQVRYFLTSVKDDDRDIGAVLLHHATRARHRADGFDLILGQQTRHQVEVGRPNWNDELRSVQREAKTLGHHKCGIFLCGPEGMAGALADVSGKISRSDPDFHFHFSKEIF